MGDGTVAAASASDRSIEQAIVGLKKGSHLLKCGRRGKPKFCPFRLSRDEKLLVWYSGEEERHLKLSTVTNIIPGQTTVNFQRQLQPEWESRSFSLIHANHQRSLDLICKDKSQADSWFLGLQALISRSHHPPTSTSTSTSTSTLRRHRGAQSCVNSPAGFFRRKHNLGLLEDPPKKSQVHSLCGSPTQSLSERCFSDGLSYSSDSLYLWESNLSNMENVMDVLVPNSPYIASDYLKKSGAYYYGTDSQKDASCRFILPTHGSPLIGKNDTLRDVMIWGEGIEGGYIAGGVGNSNEDGLLPRLLESTAMLDVQSLSLGRKHAALVTKQGEVFCWGEGSNGRLGHKVNMDVSYPKVVESLRGFHIKSVVCGEYQTCALTHSGELYAWGDNGYGAAVDENRYSCQWIPRKLSGPLEGIGISKVACGDWHTAVVTTSGRLFTYGDGTFGVLGHGNPQSVFQPKEIESLKGLWVKSVACGPWHTAAIVDIMVDRFKSNTIGGKLFTWGDGDKGRLGHADQERKLMPTCIAQLVDHDFVQVSCGRMLTVGLTNLGKVYTMGSTVHGQLGNPRAKDKSITIVEEKLREECVKEISSGSYHIAVLTSRGSVYTWGKGADGQLGLGDIEDRNSPTLVEALRDRDVESIACGSSFTAAICLHKSISVSDQLTCSECRMTFGLTRKKHNCYNCGLQFCGTCSTKKVMSASLAPNKNKPFRVCDSCFNHLQKSTHSSRQLKLENHSPRQPLTTQNTFSDERKDRREATPTRGHLLSVGQSCNESQYDQSKTLKGEEHNHFYESISHMSGGLSRWGKVSRPSLFETYCGESSMALIPFAKFPLSSVPRLSLQQISPRAKSTTSIPMDAKEVKSESDKAVNEEIQRLRAEAKSLEHQCQIRNKKIQECEQKIEGTWSLAREEAAKCKAAKDVIRALTLRLHTMSVKHSAGEETKDGGHVNLPHIATKCTDCETLEGLSPIYGDSCSLPEVGLLKDRQTNSLYGSPVVFSDTLKSVYGSKVYSDNSKAEGGEACVAKKDSKQNGSRSLNNEWVEQYEPGVYITFATLPSGQKGLRRVRFSRKLFSEKEAARWWEEKQVKVYQNYEIEGYTSSKHR